MLEDSAAPVLITQEELVTRLPFATERTVVLEDFFGQPAKPN